MKKTVFVFASLILAFIMTGCVKQVQQDSTNSQTNALSAVENTKAEKIEVVDFHGSRRCYSCQTIEKYARETLEEFFQPEIRDGKITFQSINVEEPQNQVIVQKYQARGSSLFINPITDGKDNISEEVQVWRLVRDERAFKTYFRNRINGFLN